MVTADMMDVERARLVTELEDALRRLAAYDAKKFTGCTALRFVACQGEVDVIFHKGRAPKPLCEK